MAWEISWVDMCRTCMEVDGELLPLYDEDAEITENDYAYKLGQIASVEIHKFDGLPSKICDKCAYRTNAFFDFQCLIRESDKNLKGMFNAQFDEKNSRLTDRTIRDVDETKEAQEQSKDCFLTKEEDIDLQDACDKIQLVLESTLDDDKDAATDAVESIYDIFRSTDESQAIDVDDDMKLIGRQKDCKIIEQPDLKIETPIENSLGKHTTTVEKLLDEIETSNANGSKFNDDNNKDDCDNNDDDNDSCNYLESRENIVGSINDTITRIKEIKENGKIVKYQCTLCLQNCPILSQILCHIVDFHVPITGPFYCIICEMDCNNVKELRAHVKTHNGPNPFTCFLCNKSYAMKRYLKRHMTCHIDFPRYRCTKCSERFRLKSDLESHIESFHAEGSIFKCNQCNKVYNHKGNYKRHLISHLDPKGLHLPKFPCSVCNKRFVNNRTLVTHMRVHTGEKPFTCEICNKSFSQRGNLMNHSKIHMNTRCYVCDVCGKSFNQKSTLRDHSLLHTGDKPHACSHCGERFTFGSALRRHMWSHTDEKPYECDFCKTKFIGKYDIRRHMKIHIDKPTEVKRSKLNKEKKLTDASAAENVNVVEDLTDSDNIFVEQIFMCDNNIQIITKRELEKENVDSLLTFVQY